MSPSAARAARPSKESAATARRLDRQLGALTTAATSRMEQELAWYRAMPADNRSWVNLIAQAGIAAFVDWLRDPSADVAVSADVFGTAPRELARTVSLQQTVELVRTTIAVVEDRIDELAEPGEENALREAALLYSREVAFAAAKVYAQAAEARGAWDARLEALVVDALLRDEADEAVRTRAAALGWNAGDAAVVVVGGAPSGAPEAIVDDVHRAARVAGADALAGVQADRLVVVLDAAGADVTVLVRHLLPVFAEGPVVIGPVVDDLLAAGRSARAAVAGLRAAVAWPEAPRPVSADDLLPERALAGDSEARQALVDEVHRPLLAAGATLVDTLSTYLELAGSLEGAARMLFVHPNTVRYRLRRVADVTGYTPSQPRHAFTLHLAMLLGRLADAHVFPD